ncbi:hypothetical protein SNE40_001579 [Patella caerulea]|uniref:SGNH hydrolase-type esterase domain-containing protein n=1 Tax=Patella caerulea TaxID=87958 RepID=A0AAN8K7E5_PATCE
MVLKVLVFGHSYVRRLENFCAENYLQWLNVGLDGTEIQVDFHGIGGGTVCNGAKSIKNHSQTSILNSNYYDCVFLQIGGNDLSSKNKSTDPCKLAKDIFHFSNYLFYSFNVKHIIIGQLLSRSKLNCPTGYNDKIHVVNNKIRALTADVKHITFWTHRGFWQNPESLICDKDGVHLNGSGMSKYAKSVHSAIAITHRRGFY